MENKDNHIILTDMTQASGGYREVQMTYLCNEEQISEEIADESYKRKIPNYAHFFINASTDKESTQEVIQELKNNSELCHDCIYQQIEALNNFEFEYPTKDRKAIFKELDNEAVRI